MRTQELITNINESLTKLKDSADELRDLDQELGDGDLGITITLGADAVIEALTVLGPDVTPAEVARAAAKAFASANPSTMAALVAGGLLAGSKVWGTDGEITAESASAFVIAAAENISARGKAQLGDKTILDSLFPAGEALGTSSDRDVALDAAISAAAVGVENTKDMQARRGRASWLQERSIGLQDPGATALFRYLEAWKVALEA